MDGGVIRELDRGPRATSKGDSGNTGGRPVSPSTTKPWKADHHAEPDYFIEPAKRYSATAGPRDFVLYNNRSAARITRRGCGVTTLAEKGSGEALGLRVEWEHVEYERVCRRIVFASQTMTWRQNRFEYLHILCVVPRLPTTRSSAS